MTLICRRSILASVGLELNDVELNAIRKQFYRGIRKDAFEKHLKPMIDQGLIIKQKDLHSERYSYTTFFNEVIEEDLRKRQLAAVKKQEEKMKLVELELAKSKTPNVNMRSNISKGLKDLSESMKIDKDLDPYK